MNVQQPCPSCGKPSPRKFQARDYNRRISSDLFDYFCCPDCGLIFIDPIPADLSRFYPNDYYNVPTNVDELAKTIPAAQYKMLIVNRFANSGRFLEIGPAYGDLALQAKRAGFEVEAIEMDARCCEFLTQHVGIKAICSSDILAALRDCKPYDVIALWHVIEHLPDPRKTMEAIADKLNPGGVAIIAAPNPAAFQFRVLGKRWAHVDAPRHLRLIPLPLLDRYAKEFQMSLEWSTTDDPGARGWNKFGWVQSLTNLVVGPISKRLMKKIARWIFKLAKPYDCRPGRGSAYTAVFRKGQA